MLKAGVMSALMASVAVSGGVSDAPAVGELLQAGVYSNIYSSDPANRSFNIAGVVHRAPGEGPFGGLCVQFDGNRESGIVDPTLGASYLDFGTGNFTVECWFKITPGSSPSNATLMSQWSSNGTYRSWTVEYNSGVEVRFRFRTSASSTVRTASFAISDSEAFENAGWHHVAAQRRGTVCEIYVDGVKGGTTYTIGTTALQAPNSFYPPCYGCAWNSASSSEAPFESAKGFWMDLVRITKGTARYTANFTPPTAPYPTGVDDPNWAQVMWHFTHSGSWGYDISADSLIQLPIYERGGPMYLNVGYSGNSNYVGHIDSTGLAGRSGDSADFYLPDASYDIGSSDFTFDIICRHRALDAVTDTVGFGFVQSSGAAILSFGSGAAVSTVRFGYRNATGSVLTNFDFAGISTSEDTALCVTRSGNTMRFYRNGNKVGEATFTGAIPTFYTGSFGNKFVLNKATSGLNVKASRIIRGHAKYTGETRTTPTIEDLRSL